MRLFWEIASDFPSRCGFCSETRGAQTVGSTAQTVGSTAQICGLYSTDCGLYSTDHGLHSTDCGLHSTDSGLYSSIPESLDTLTERPLSVKHIRSSPTSNLTSQEKARVCPPCKEATLSLNNTSYLCSGHLEQY